MSHVGGYLDLTSIYINLYIYALGRKVMKGLSILCCY